MLAHAPPAPHANQPPDAPIVLSPPDGGQASLPSTELRVQVSDPDGDPLTVTFYARPHPFTLIHIPDTQVYSQHYPEIFEEITHWIVANWQALDAVYAVHVGDIVETADNIDQWEIASAAMAILEDPMTTGLADGIPYGILPGNHDTPLGNYETYFGVNRFAGRSYYHGNYPSGSNACSYTLFSAGGMDFININLENNPRQDELDWADALLKQYSNRRAIVSSHSLILWRQGEQGAWSPSGERIFEELGDNPNLFMLLGGHSRTETKRVDVSASGTTVYTLVADYTNQANGNIRLLEFSPAENLIHVRTYSPHLGVYETDEDSQFDLELDMSNAGFSPIGVVENVPSGGSASQTLDKLIDGVRYEWYVTVSDGVHTTTGPVWSFTASDGPILTSPAAPQTSIALDGDDVVLSWPPVTADVNGDPISVSHYEIWRSLTPSCAPGAADCPAPLAETALLSFTDTAVALTKTPYYYLVTAVSADGLASDASNEVGKFGFTLVSDAAAADTWRNHAR